MKSRFLQRATAIALPLILCGLLLGCGEQEEPVYEDETTYSVEFETEDPYADLTEEPDEETTEEPTEAPTEATTKKSGTTKKITTKKPTTKKVTTTKKTTTTTKPTTTQKYTTIPDATKVSTTKGTGTTSSTTSTSSKTTTTTSTAYYKVTGITLSGASSFTLMAGKSQSLSYTISPSNATNKNVTFSSSNKSIASVNAAGVVTGVGKGTCTITVTTIDPKADENYTDTVDVTVTTIPVAEINISSPGGASSVKMNSSLQLSAKALGANGTTPTNESVTWSSGDSTVATVSASGLVTGKNAGSTTITATAADGSGTKKEVTIVVTMS